MTPDPVSALMALADAYAASVGEHVNDRQPGVTQEQAAEYGAAARADLRAAIEEAVKDVERYRAGFISALTMAGYMADPDEFKPQWLTWLGVAAESLPDGLSAGQAIDDATAAPPADAALKRGE